MVLKWVTETKKEEAEKIGNQRNTGLELYGLLLYCTGENMTRTL